MDSTTYTVKYARGKAHIAGLAEKVVGGPDSLNYSRSACAALSRSMSWCNGPSSTDLREILDQADRYGTGLCVKCRKTAEEALAAEVASVEETHAETEDGTGVEPPAVVRVDVVDRTKGCALILGPTFDGWVGRESSGRFYVEDSAWERVVGYAATYRTAGKVLARYHGYRSVDVRVDYEG